MPAILDFTQTLLTAAACFCVALCILWASLEIYRVMLNTALKLIGVHGALIQFIWEKRNKQAWWQRFGSWYDRMRAWKADN